MKTTKWMASLAVGTALLGPTLNVNAQYVQNAIGIPTAPGCGPGESWTKNGARYQCQTPQPSCAYGFASGPVWTGSSWSFVCNAPPPPPPSVGIPVGTPESQVCAGALATIDPWGTPDAAYMHWLSDLVAGMALFGSLVGPVNGTASATFNAVFAQQNQTGISWTTGNVPNVAGIYDLWWGTDGYGGVAFCWVQPGTTNVVGLYYILMTPQNANGNGN
jgi:hypothetical protein